MTQARGHGRSSDPGRGRTYVLVHGAFHGGWCWKPVAKRLRQRGHEVYTPTLTGLGERSHLRHCNPTLGTFVEDVLQVLHYEELTEVILVGHSFGGITITGVADRALEKLRHLVYLDAAILQSGQAMIENSPPAHAEEYRRAAMPSAWGLNAMPRDPAYYGITDPQAAEWLRAKLTPQPFALHEERVHYQHPVGNGIATTYIACTAPYLASTARARDYARSRQDWRYLELAAPHNAMMLQPDAVTDILDAID